ncbi:MAG: CcmD family protein [Actinomycetota bacterium]
MSDIGWMVVAFVAVGAGIGGYMLSIAARRRRLHRRLDRSAHERDAARP